MFEAYKRLTNTVVTRVNRVRLPNKRTRDAITPKHIQTQFIAEVQYAASQPFVLAPMAEISQRYANNRILAVSTGVRLTNVTDDDIGVFVLNKDVSFTDVPPPVNFFLHEYIYTHTPSTAVLLCHPLNIYKTWRRGKMPDFSLLPGFEEKIGEVAVCEMDQLEEVVAYHRLALVPAIGMFSHAPSLFDAISQVKLLEWICALMDVPAAG
jgi:ribulose-5-phosphate 4-epimerase/fuculose-1-phosphate aldolase